MSMVRIRMEMRMWTMPYVRRRRLYNLRHGDGVFGAEVTSIEPWTTEGLYVSMVMVPTTCHVHLQFANHYWQFLVLLFLFHRHGLHAPLQREPCQWALEYDFRSQI